MYTYIYVYIPIVRGVRSLKDLGIYLLQIFPEIHSCLNVSSGLTFISIIYTCVYIFIYISMYIYIYIYIYTGFNKCVTKIVDDRKKSLCSKGLSFFCQLLKEEPLVNISH